MSGTLQLRTAEPGDELNVAAVHVAAWQAGYAGLLPATYLDGLRAEDRAARYTFCDHEPGRPVTVIALDGGEVVGFAMTGPARGVELSRCGELYALYVDPGRWRQGIGRALIVDARRRLVTQGFTQSVLWVLEGNARGERFYQADGWRRNGWRRHDKLHGVDLDELGYRRVLA